jgi:hypothetical protein
MSRRFLKSILGSVLAVSLAGNAMGQFNQQQGGFQGGGFQGGGGSLGLQSIGGISSTGGFGQQSFGGLGQSGGFGQTGGLGQTGFGQTGFGQTGQSSFGSSASNPFGQQGFGGATGLGQNPFGSLAGSAVLGATMGGRTGGLSGGLGGFSGGLGGLGGGLGGLGGLGGRNTGGRTSRGGFNQNQNQQNQNGQKQVRATVKLGFSVPGTTSATRSTDINSRLNRMANATVRGVIVQMEGRTAVITGRVPTLDDGKMMERLLSLEPGIDRVKNELIYESGETNPSGDSAAAIIQSVNVPAPSPQASGTARPAVPLIFAPTVVGSNAGTSIGLPAQVTVPEVVPAPAR